MASVSAKRSVWTALRGGARLMSGLALLAVAACGGGASAPTSAGSATGPAWMNRGSGPSASERGRAFYGVGVSEGVKGQAMRRKDADGKARDEIAGLVANYNAKLARSYATAAGDAAQEQTVVDALKAIAGKQLAPVRIVDHWVSKSGNESALSMLDLETLKASIDKAETLAAEIRDALKAAADKAFDDPDEPKS